MGMNWKYRHEQENHHIGDSGLLWIVLRIETMVVIPVIVLIGVCGAVVASFTEQPCHNLADRAIRLGLLAVCLATIVALLQLLGSTPTPTPPTVDVLP